MLHVVHRMLATSHSLLREKHCNGQQILHIRCIYRVENAHGVYADNVNKEMELIKWNTGQ